MITFIVGLVIGELVGIMIMCMLQINKKYDD